MFQADDLLFASDAFRGVWAKGIALGLNQLCEQGRMALFSVEDEMLAYYPLKGNEFKAREIDGRWIVSGTPLDYCRFVKSGMPKTVSVMSWGGEIILTLPISNADRFEEGMDFDSVITISS